MATKGEFAAFVTEQLGGERAGIVARKMFGEYGVYCEGKFFALICDNTLYIKPTAKGEALLAARDQMRYAPPYNGAKDWLQIEDLDDKAILATLTEETIAALPVPKPKAPRKKETKA